LTLTVVVGLAEVLNVVCVSIGATIPEPCENGGGSRV
jgi:hypothetical protein